jgi:TPR repeat protein
MEEIEEFAEFLERTNGGDDSTFLVLGEKYATGDGVAQNLVKAAKWFEKAALLGHPQAQYNLGILYIKGEGVAKDFAKAAEWLQKAARQGYEEAQHALNVLQGR